MAILNTNWTSPGNGATLRTLHDRVLDGSQTRLKRSVLKSLENLIEHYGEDAVTNLEVFMGQFTEYDMERCAAVSPIDVSGRPKEAPRSEEVRQ